MLTSNLNIDEGLARQLDITQLVRLVEFLKNVSGFEVDIKFCTYMRASLLHKGIARLEQTISEKTIHYTLYTSVLTLLGPLGALPAHYNQHTIKNMKEHDTMLLKFLDVFYNRLMSLLYKIVQDSDLVLALRKYVLTDWAEPLVTFLNSLSGICRSATSCLGATLHSVGVMLHSRPACGLHRLLSSFLKLPIVVEQFRPLKSPLEECHKSLLAKQNSTLSSSFYVGHHAYLYQNLISVSIQDLDAKTFKALMAQKKDPNSPLHTLLRAYLGKAINYSLQLEAQEEAKLTKLSCTLPASLGSDTWCSTGRRLN